MCARHGVGLVCSSPILMCAFHYLPPPFFFCVFSLVLHLVSGAMPNCLRMWKIRQLVHYFSRLLSLLDYAALAAAINFSYCSRSRSPRIYPHNSGKSTYFLFITHFHQTITVTHTRARAYSFTQLLMSVNAHTYSNTHTCTI